MTICIVISFNILSGSNNYFQVFNLFIIEHIFFKITDTLLKVSDNFQISKIIYFLKYIVRKQ
jgi:hypothetical protein